MRFTLALLLPIAALTASATADNIPDMGQIRDIVEEVFEDEKGNSRDLIDQRQVQGVLKALEDDLEWELPDGEELMKQVLPPRHTLVRTLRSPAGLRFMRKVSKYKLIYDRLDRISRVSGGAEMIKALIKLPDATRYAKFSTRREVPDMIDFLPKKRNGKTRKIPNYKKPTHRIYTQSDLLARLEISRAIAIRDAKKGK